MTDEELADEYVKEEGFRSGGVFGELDDITSSEANKEIKQAFLAGLKSGRPKWHKVADGDLPRQDGHTCFSIEVLANNKKWIHYRFDSAKWFCGSKEVKVIAWCEIPQYKEE